jgi:hypothetical protein
MEISYRRLAMSDFWATLARAFNSASMSAGDLHVEVQYGDIVVTLPYTPYTVTYYKPAFAPASGQALPRQRRSTRSPDPRGVVALAWKLANAKARELGWVV